MNYIFKNSGIMFKRDMILAYIDGRKNQTRRTKGLTQINKNPDEWELIFSPKEPGIRFVSFGHKVEKIRILHIKMPYGCVGDMLWFKETWKMWERDEDCKDFLHYRADDAKVDPVWWTEDDWTKPHPVWLGRFENWQSSMFMPMVCSRFRNIPIVGVRVERLMDITGADCLHEGVGQAWNKVSDLSEWLEIQRKLYFSLWDSINGKTLPASKNPWVWVYTFQKYQKEV